MVGKTFAGLAILPMGILYSRIMASHELSMEKNRNFKMPMIDVIWPLFLQNHSNESESWKGS